MEHLPGVLEKVASVSTGLLTGYPQIGARLGTRVGTLCSTRGIQHSDWDDGDVMETRLKAARESRQWSQLRLLSELLKRGRARGLPMPSQASLKTAISRWENGSHVPQEPYCELLAEIYETAPAALGLVTPPGLPLQRSAPLTANRLTPEAVTFLDSLFDSYAKADNAIGPGHLLQVACQHVVHLEPLLLTAKGGLRQDGLRLCSRFAEFAGWLCQDAGDLEAAQHWTDRALDFVEELGAVEARAYVLMRKSGIAAERQEHGRSASLAEASCKDLGRLPARLQALNLRQRAISYAVVGDERESERAVDQALRAMASVNGDVDQLGYCTPSYVAMESGVSAFHLGRLDVAAARLGEAAATWPDGFTRDQGLCLARLGVVEAARGNLELACAVGRDAIAVAQVADSARTRAVLVSLNRRLAPYDRVALVSEFRDGLTKLG
jgi:transcriptional regulator with XRE-family HTH domain